MEKGDKVTIVPNDTHPRYVKIHYGEILEIEEVKKDSFFDRPYYKVKGIKGYAREADLQLIEE